MNKQGWAYIKLGDVITPAKIVKNENRTNLPVLSITMHDGIVFQKSRFKKSIASVDTSNYKIVENGQLVIAFPIDEGLIYTQDIVEAGIMSPAYNIWDVDFSNLNKRFLVMYLHCPFAMEYYKSHLRSTTMRRRSMHKSDLLNMPLPLPPIEVQEAIVAELDEINEAIEAMQQQIADLDALAQSTFYTMFGDPVTNEKGWDVKKIGDVCIDKKAVLRASSFFKPEDKINYIDISSIDNQINKIIATTPYTYSKAPSRAQQIVIKGDILISLVRPNLKNVAMVLEEDNQLVASSGFCVLRTSANTNNIYIFNVVKSNEFTNHLIGKVQGANYPAVRENDIKNYSIPIPPLALQQQFAKKVEAIEAAKAELTAQIAEMQTLLASRMDYYFD